MIRPLSRPVAGLLTAIALAVTGSAHATSVMLDFETEATGSTIAVSPLTTALGTITASASAGSLLAVLSDPGSTGMVGNSLKHVQILDSDYGQLAFDFDVGTVSFLYAGSIAGAFTAQALDSAFGVVDSFTDLDTNDDLPGGPITLSGTGIRYFRFADEPSSLQASVVDDVVITSGVPMPPTAALMALGLAGLAASRRRRR